MNINLVSPTEVKAILARHGLHPKRRLGQNFLIDRNILDKIVGSAELTSESNVLEIGPGLGTVTREAADRAGRVVAVEMDRDMCAVLRETVGDRDNVEVVEADFLKLNLPEFLGLRFGSSRCTVLANLPYYITSPVIIKLIESKDLLDRIVVMVQQEVAERMVARPGTSAYGSLSVFVQYHCSIGIVAKAKHTVFFPAPEVDSSVVRMEVLPGGSVQVSSEILFFRVVRAAFGQRRKTLLAALSGSPDLRWSRDLAAETLKRAGIDPTRRGETLSLSEFASLADAGSSVLQ